MKFARLDTYCLVISVQVMGPRYLTLQAVIIVLFWWLKYLGCSSDSGAVIQDLDCYLFDDCYCECWYFLLWSSLLSW